LPQQHHSGKQPACETGQICPLFGAVAFNSDKKGRSSGFHPTFPFVRSRFFKVVPQAAGINNQKAFSTRLSGEFELGLCGGEASYRHTEGGAGDIVETDYLAELD